MEFFANILLFGAIFAIIMVTDDREESKMKRLQRNIDEAVIALTEKTMLAADAERILIAHSLIGKNADEPQPVRFARAMAEILDRVSVPLEDYDLIAGHVLHRELDGEEEAIFAELRRDPH
jgi:hypothetical protein